MSNTLNTAVCLTKNGYKGKAGCTTSPLGWVGFLLLAKGTIVTATNVAGLYPYLLGLVTNDTPALRAFNFPEIRGQVSQVKAKKTFSFPDESEITTRRSLQRWQFQFYKGLCDHIQNLVFKGQQNNYDLMPYDANGLLLGKQVFDPSTGVALGQGGWDLTEIDVPDWDAATFTDAAKFFVELQLSNARQMNEGISQIAVNDFILSDLPGVQSVALATLGGTLNTITSGVITITALSGCAGGNLAAGAIGVALAVAGAWVVTNAATGATLTVTTVAVNAAKTGFTFAIATTSPYPSTGGQVNFKLASVSALVALGVKFYETPDGITVVVA